MNTLVSVPIARLANIYWLESRTELIKNLRIPAFAISSIAFPVMFYVFFGLIFNRDGMSGDMPAYMLATYSVFGVIGPALFSFGVGVSVERDQGWLALKQCSPMPISAYFVARVFSALVFGLAIALILFALGYIFGNVSMSPGQWTLTLVILLLGSLPFSAIGLWLGLSLKAQVAPAVVNLIYLPMAFLSGLWLPIQYFPEILQKAAWLMPAFHLSQLVLSVQGLSLGFNSILHILIILVTSAVFLGLAFRAFIRQSIN
ncbi:ABC transporter permease [Gilvimarinus sp. SDUM040013]|uniref:Transport permease protein n=1 Tax=Gilvimarinus gilvus TaxID=3058038 RepID=A0ABU4S5M4_9GAMM|nr:ABC transporter permease [Gilvimarinus sp. SDUM040013]MDO3385809.1 ABC transporter permease [Gilvimarinus sp. SDUM040013]MDX6850629.1 ABC transporter permease [Gilvimarinus sp. SDUM040013]